MESKLFVYAVIAVTLGYLLVSTVPEQLAALQGETMRAATEAKESLDVEEPKIYGEETERLSEDVAPLTEEISGDKASVDAAKEAAEEVEVTFGLSKGRDIAATISLWIVNLLIALGVYLIAKRRLY